MKCTLCLAPSFDGQFDLAKKGFLQVIRSVRNSRGYDEEFQENCKALLHDCVGAYVSRRRPRENGSPTSRISSSCSRSKKSTSTKEENMAKDIYRELQECIDQYSVGFGATESGVELKILKKLFTEEEVRMYMDLTLDLESAQEVAAG